MGRDSGVDVMVVMWWIGQVCATNKYVPQRLGRKASIKRNFCIDWLVAMRGYFDHIARVSSRMNKTCADIYTA